MKGNLLLPVGMLSATLVAGCAGTPDSESAAMEAATAPASTSADAGTQQPPATSGDAAPASTTMSPAIPTDTGQAFADMDVNKDGSLTRDAVANDEMLNRHFAQVGHGRQRQIVTGRSGRAPERNVGQAALRVRARGTSGAGSNQDSALRTTWHHTRAHLDDLTIIVR